MMVKMLTPLLDTLNKNFMFLPNKIQVIVIWNMLRYDDFNIDIVKQFVYSMLNSNRVEYSGHNEDKMMK